MEESQPKKIKIINTEYKEKQDLVYWDVEIIGEGKRMKLAMPGQELIDSFGIVGDVSAVDMLKFLKDMKGKEVNWVVNSRTKLALGASPEQQAEQLSNAIDQDPFFEVIQAESE